MLCEAQQRSAAGAAEVLEAFQRKLDNMVQDQFVVSCICLGLRED